MSVFNDLVNKRDDLQSKFEGMVSAARRANRDDLLPGEQQVFNDLKAINSRLDYVEREAARGDVSDLSRRVNQTPQGQSKMKIDDRALVYRQSDTRTSWVRDLIRQHAGLDDSYESRNRLSQHAQEVQTHAAYAEFRDLSRVDGQGGYAVPPAWLLNEYIELARPGRAFANLCQRQPLPGGTDSINIPKVLTGTSVGVQTADNATVVDVDLTDTFINAPVRTIAGAQGLAIQLIDQSPIAFDDVIFRDLTAAHAGVTDAQVIGGSGSNGQVLGVNNTAGIQTIAVASTTIGGIYSAIANGIQLVHSNRFLPPEVIVMHPRRWGWLLSLLDTTNRPLFVPTANSAYNAAGVLTDVASQQVVGHTHGLPIVTDPNISTTSGTEYSSYGDEDAIYILRSSDLILWESGIRARVLPEPKAANLTVLLQIFSYFAFSAARYPASVVTITGLGAPTF